MEGTPTKFILSKIREKSLKIWRKSRQKWLPTFVYFIKCHLTFAEIHMKTFALDVTPKESLHDFCGRNVIGQSRTRTLRASWGNSSKNPSHPQKLPPPTPMIRALQQNLQCHVYPEEMES